ncbi:hypothetical protein M8C21_030162 [Ambrosia artemisiifolia]|uniref:Uncharacterized protein n=1 Tax=Ambrosia artemisiifolia TaxID=4212 RepID=A0AAD5DAS0_AMBAR|nr:hypothetical protein M8C21_030162 [Ambrosia artemisiifolia]
MATREAVKPEKTDYMKLPCPVPYEEINREAFMSLNAEYFEGMRVDFTKRLNQRFSLSHSITMGPTEIPCQSTETIKIPTAHYDFGADFMDPKLMLRGRVMTDGRVDAALTSEPQTSRGMFNIDYKIANTGNVALSYVQKVSEKVSLVSDLMYNHISRDVIASFGYDYILRQCRVRGKIDSNGCTSAFVEESLNEGLKFVLSAELDHKKKDYRFGFGFTVGEY